MRGVNRFIAVAGLALFGLSQQASAAVLYDNGPINGTIDGWTVNYGFAVADSFTLSQTSTVTGVSFGVWNDPSATITSIDWGITTVTGSFPDQHTATVTNGSTITPNPNPYGFNPSTDSFSTGSLVLGPGTYYLVLQNAVVSGGDPVYWDQNNGPSLAWENSLGEISYHSNDSCLTVTCSESFQILGSTSATPLPSTWTMLIAGFVGLGFFAYRGTKKNVSLAAA
jgi:hypothetical protein